MSSTRIPIKALSEATMSALVKLGHSTETAVIMTETLMYAEMRSNNQGLIKLVTGALGPSPKCGALRVIFESPVSAKLDGAHNSGMAVVHEAVRLGITKAKFSGISIVGCSNYASATGALGHWAKNIADHGLIGLVMCQCNEMVAPHGSFEPIFGTNPFAIGIPTQPRAQVLDMATSSMAYFGLKTAEAEGKSIPPDVAYDEKGKSTTDPSEALQGALRVFDRSYKGSHIALMVELLAGSLTGAAAEDKGTAQNWGSHMPYVICHMPYVICHMLYAICYMPYVICHMLHLYLI
jgi:L-2-hydroxycarboxylate dehydrogenase (NAD+)